jgi:hypothetical protein
MRHIAPIYILVTILFSLSAHPASAQYGCTGTPTITSLVPSSGKIYPPGYGPYRNITCSRTAPCTLDDMTIPYFASGSSSPYPDLMAWYGSNFCEGGGLQGTLWWLSEFGGQAGETWMLTDLPWGFDYGTPAGGLYAGTVGVYLGGYFGTDLLPDITPAQFGPSANPLSAVNIIDAGGGSFPVYTGNSLPFNLIGPYEMGVVRDYWQYCDNCDTTIERRTQYEVLNSDGSPAANIPIGEDMAVSGWNCSQPNPGIEADSCVTASGQRVGKVLSAGMGATDANGEFIDSWSLNDDAYAPAGCGHAMVDQWQLCGLAVVVNPVAGTFTYPNYGLDFAGLNGRTDTNAVGQNVNGTLYVLPGPGCGPLYLSCPDRIPTGTIITPSN